MFTTVTIILLFLIVRENEGDGNRKPYITYKCISVWMWFGDLRLRTRYKYC